MNHGIGNVKAKIESGELLTTTTAPTESGGVITISTSDISGTPKENNYLAYIDSDNITALYKITNISSGTATLSLIGNVGGGGGSQLYQHNINFNENSGGSLLTQATTTVITDSSTPFTYDTFKQWLISKGLGFTSENWYVNHKWLQASGITISSDVHYNIMGIMTFSNATSHIQAVFIKTSSGTTSLDRRNIKKNDTNVEDAVIAL